MLVTLSAGLPISVIGYGEIPGAAQPCILGQT